MNTNTNQYEYTEIKRLIGNAIMNGIIKKGISIKQFSEKIERNEQEIYKWLYDTPNFKLHTIVLIEIALDIKIINVNRTI